MLRDRLRLRDRANALRDRTKGAERLIDPSVSVANGPSVNEVNGLSVSKANGPSVSVTNDPKKQPYETPIHSSLYLCAPYGHAYLYLQSQTDGGSSTFDCGHQP